ncbi:MAG TPA: ABC transporter substrate-binding protein [Chthoniobacterales bacterium]|nr:ABC transporter substrate-binding protein [Chthoniobacterales bacterium]
MKTSFPLNSIPTGSIACKIGFRPAPPAVNHLAKGTANASKRFAFAIRTLAPTILLLLAWTSFVRAADSDTQGKTIVFVPGVMGNAFYVTMERGIRAEAAKYGFKIDIQGAQQFDPTLQTPIVNAVVASKPAGLIVAPTDSKALFVPISQAVDAGIKVALVDTTLDDTSKVVTAIATDNAAGGAAAADALAKLIGEKGKVLVIAFQAGASTSDQRQKGFENEIKKYPNINYIGFQISNNDPSKAAAEVESTLTAHPDLAGIFATNDRSAEGTATALRVADKVGVVKVVGFDAGETQIKQLKDGLVQALIAQQPYQIGVDGVDAIANALTGKNVEHSVITETVTVTKDNLQEPEVQKALYKLKGD